MVTPLLGAGLLVWAGPGPVIGLDAATFGLAAAAAAALRLRADRPGRRRGPPWAAITAGLRHIAATPVLRRVVAAVVIGATVFGFFETVQFAVVGTGLHRSPAFLGVLTAAQGGGAVLGGLLAAPVLARTSERLLVGSGLLACALSCLAATTGQLALVLAAGALLGVCIVWINVGAITLVQRQTPARLLGRVDAAANVLVTVPQAISIAVGAAAIAVLDYRILLAVMAAVMLAAAGYLARVPGSRGGHGNTGHGDGKQSSAEIDTIPCDVRTERTKETGMAADGRSTSDVERRGRAGPGAPGHRVPRAQPGDPAAGPRGHRRAGTGGRGRARLPAQHGGPQPAHPALAQRRGAHPGPEQPAVPADRAGHRGPAGRGRLRGADRQHRR